MIVRTGKDIFLNNHEEFYVVYKNNTITVCHDSIKRSPLNTLTKYFFNFFIVNKPEEATGTRSVVKNGHRHCLPRSLQFTTNSYYHKFQCNKKK